MTTQEYILITYKNGGIFFTPLYDPEAVLSNVDIAFYSNNFSNKKDGMVIENYIGIYSNMENAQVEEYMHYIPESIVSLFDDGRFMWAMNEAWFLQDGEAIHIDMEYDNYESAALVLLAYHKSKQEPGMHDGKLKMLVGKDYEFFTL